MDLGTHALASVALVRAALPRAPRAIWTLVILAGTIADLDALSAFVGPSAFLKWHHTDSHSLVASVALSALLTGVYLLLSSKPSPAQVSPPALFGLVLLAQLLHLALDASQSEGIALLWPFSGRRVAADWLPSIDPWIIALLIAAILLPELLRLVGDEIGANDKRPRGRIGAIVGFAMVLLYVGGRATLHSNAVATVEARDYRGQSPRRVAAFPGAASLFTWHAIVETDSALHELTVNVGPGSSFDPETGVALFKPEPSPALEKARNSDSAKRFVAAARFPKATVEKTSDGYEVQLRDLRYAAAGEIQHEVVALIKIDANGNVADEELIWARDLRRR
jgi:membrane-bound metal-dependent hydrolase YbcI (DUF457 family)